MLPTLSLRLRAQFLGLQNRARVYIAGCLATPSRAQGAVGFCEVPRHPRQKFLWRPALCVYPGCRNRQLSDSSTRGQHGVSMFLDHTLLLLSRPDWGLGVGRVQTSHSHHGSVSC
jgi:hypothetical protein